MSAIIFALVIFIIISIVSGDISGCLAYFLKGFLFIVLLIAIIAGLGYLLYYFSEDRKIDDAVKKCYDEGGGYLYCNDTYDPYWGGDY